jgi:crotonobetainyl-CoA:carnitine CoA-transferase CaiB-like acyl-CoA transferase
VGAPELKHDPRFTTDALRGNHSLEVSRLMAAWCETRTRDDVLGALAKAKIPAGPVYTPQEALDDPHINAAGLLTQREFAGLQGTFPMAPHPVEMSGTPAQYRHAAPTLGQHTDEVLSELGFAADAIAALHEQGVV